MKELLQRLKVAKLTELTPFEGLLHVKIADGVPVMTADTGAVSRMMSATEPLFSLPPASGWTGRQLSDS